MPEWFVGRGAGIEHVAKGGNAVAHFVGAVDLHPPIGGVEAVVQFGIVCR